MTTTESPPITELIKLIPDYDPYKDILDKDGKQLYYFDEQAAQIALDFFPGYLCFTKGEWMGRPFYLGDWQKAIVANIFGWKKCSDGKRRYREVFFYVPRKNGKTELMGGIANYVFLCDGEPAAEVYAAAAEKDQARIVWQVSKQMILLNEELSAACKIYQHSIVIPTMNSFYKPISADAKTKHGFSLHLGLLDELHAQRDAELLETLETAQGSRSQPLMIMMTTADSPRPSICNDKLDYAEKVRDGVYKDPAFLPIIYKMEKDDDWHDPKEWQRVNPNWGVSVNPEEFERQYEKAKKEPAFQNTFRRLRLNTQTEKANRWMDMDSWKKCGKEITPAELEALKGQLCYGGLDLASTIDIAAFVLYFPESKIILGNYYIPEDTAIERSKVDRVPYTMWSDRGHVKMTPGNRIDYDYIQEDIIQASKDYKLKSVAFDSWGALQLSINLSSKHGIEMLEFRQGSKSFNEPSKKIETGITKGEIRHGGCPVLTWMMGNVVMNVDKNESISPNKQKSSEKIDGVVALIMAYGLWLIEEMLKPNPYESREMRTIEFTEEDDILYGEDDDLDDLPEGF